jgi:predicted membrane-bound mannosyltransferase
MITETDDNYLGLKEGVSSRAQSFRLNRLLESAIPVTWETAIVGILALTAVTSRLWALGARVMSHDESLHVYYSWLLATGKGFAHNPMMHGP